MGSSDMQTVGSPVLEVLDCNSLESENTQAKRLYRGMACSVRCRRQQQAPPGAAGCSRIMPSSCDCQAVPFQQDCIDVFDSTAAQSAGLGGAAACTYEHPTWSMKHAEKQHSATLLPSQCCSEPLMVGHTQQEVPLRSQLELCTHRGALAGQCPLLPGRLWPLLLP